MKKLFLGPIVIALALILGGAGCKSQVVDREENPIDQQPYIDGKIKQAPGIDILDIKAKSLLELPNDGYVDMIRDNPNSYSVTYFSNESISNLRSFYEDQLDDLEYDVQRPWTVGEETAVVTYNKEGDVIAINMRLGDERTIVEVQHQYAQ